MSKWCNRCTRTPYRSCDSDCPIFGLDFEDLADKYFNLLNAQLGDEEAPTDEELLPNDCLYIKGFLGFDYDGVPSVKQYECGYSDGDSIIDKIESYARTHGYYAETSRGLGGRHALIKNCNIRAYFTKKETSLYVAQMAHDIMMYGGDLTTEVSYVGYSEWTITGLDIDEFKIGGHDLTREFNSHIGEYIHLIIECK